MAGATVKVLLAKDLTTIVDGRNLDAAGHLSLPLTESLTPGTVVLVQAQKDGAVLSGLFTVPGAAFTAKQTAADAQWALDLATTIVTRKLASKVADVIRSAPPDTTATLPGIQAQLPHWVQQVRVAIQGTLLDARADQALAAARQHPTVENVESLANNLIRYTPLRSVFVNAVDLCNQQVVTHMANGGPLVVPAVWQVAEVQTETPQLTLVAADQLQISHGATKALVTIANAADRLASARASSTATPSNDRFARVNTTYVPAAATGGGGGGAPARHDFTLAPATGSTAGFRLVTLNGTGFTGATAVTFGGVAAKSFTVVSDNQITAVTPAHAAGTVNVAVTTPGATLIDTGSFTYSKVMATIAGDGSPTSTGDGGPAPAATIHDPVIGTWDPAGNLIIADYDGNRIRKINMTTGVISTIAGDGTLPVLPADLNENGPAVNAKVRHPNGIVADAAGNIYVAEATGQRVRKIDTAGVITTIAGDGTAGYSGDNGPAVNARLNGPASVAIDSTGNLYIAESSGHRVRMIDTAGNISTICGNGTGMSSGDNGPATSATVFSPGVVVVDGATIYVLERSGRKVRMFPVGGGTITTICGTGGLNTSTGDGGPATLATIMDPYGLSIDPSGNIYVAERGGNRVRVFTVGGNISTFCGNGTGTSTGDGGAPADATVHGALGTVFDAAGNIYVFEGNGHRIRVY